MKDITPTKYRCPETSPFCPAVFKTDRNTYIIIGKRIQREVAIGVPEDENQKMITDRIGPNEAAIEIDQALLEEALQMGKDPCTGS